MSKTLSSCPFVYFFFYLLLLHLSHTHFSPLPLFNYFPSSLSAFSQNTSLSAQNSSHDFLPLSYFMFYPSIHPSIHPPTTTFSHCLTLISLPMLWLVSPISVRTVITAVSSLGKNKVILCSRQNKRQRRNKREGLSQKKEAESRKKF